LHWNFWLLLDGGLVENIGLEFKHVRLSRFSDCEALLQFSLRFIVKVFDFIDLVLIEDVFIPYFLEEPTRI